MRETRELTPLDLANQECALWQERCREHEKRIKRIHKWLKNGGEEQVKRALQEAEAASEELRKTYTPDPETLRQPCTI